MGQRSGQPLQKHCLDVLESSVEKGMIINLLIHFTRSLQNLKVRTFISTFLFSCLQELNYTRLLPFLSFTRHNLNISELYILELFHEGLFTSSLQKHKSRILQTNPLS